MKKLVEWIRGNLVRRLVGPSLVLSIVAVLLVGSIAYISVRNVLIDSVHTRLEKSLDLHDAELKRWIADQKQDIVFLSRTPFFRNNVADILSYKSSHRYYADGYKNLSEFLFSYIKHYPGMQEVMVLSGTDGKVLISTSRENEGASRADYLFFARGKEDIYTQGVYSWGETGEPAITVAAPLLDHFGRRKGVLAVHLDLQRMTKVVFGDAGLGTTGETYIVDRHNRFVSTQQSGLPDFSREVDSAGIRLAVQGGQGGGLYRNYLGVPVVGSYRWLPELEVALLAEISQAESFAPARSFGWLIVGIGTFLSGLLFMGNLAAAKRIATPLLNLSKMASRVAAGDLSAKAEVLNQDETGDLTSSFNQMVDRLNTLYGELRTNATYFSTVFQLSPNAIAVVDLETSAFVDVNDSFAKLFGFRSEEVIGRSFLELRIWHSEVERVQAKAQLRKCSVVQGMEVTFNRREGGTFLGVLSARVIELRGVPHVIAVVWDISEQRRTEQELHSNKERLQLLIERMPIGCIAWDEKFRVVLWNTAAEKIFGFTSAEALGRHANDLLVPEEVIPQIDWIYQRLLAGDTTAHSENPNRTKDGRTIICDWYNTPLRDQAGKPIGAISMVRDISERKRTEEELERYRQRLEVLVSERTRQLEEAQGELVEKERLAVLGQLTATVSHELRNPLGTVANAIFSIKDALQQEQLERLDKALTLAERNVRRCDGIISELLDFTRNHDLLREPLDLGPWLTGLLEEQQLPPDIHLDCELPTGFVVCADAERLRRAIINVLDNAVQALGENLTRNGRIRLDLQREVEGIGIDIVDNGPGITEDVIDRIFEPLFSTKGFGIGLGMSVVKNIIEDHGGNVAVRNIPEGGVKVTLWLPGQGEESQWHMS